MHPGEIRTAEHLVQALDVARRRAARGSGRGRISLSELAQRTGIPRSTVHVYLTGKTLPTPDAFDAVLQALGVPAADLRPWADALERLAAPPPGGPGPETGSGAGPQRFRTNCRRPDAGSSAGRANWPGSTSCWTRAPTTSRPWWSP